MTNTSSGSSGREGESWAPFFFWSPGEMSQSFPAPLSSSPGHVHFRVNSLQILTRLVEREQAQPGSLKRALCWLAPFTPPPCWHQVERVEMKPAPLGIEVTLHLTPCPFEEAPDV